MTPAVEERWRAAQVAELRYHMRLMDPRLEARLHDGIAGLLRLARAETAARTVLDVGCGPLSLMFDYPPLSGVGLDPLDFGPEREAGYATRGLSRVRVPAEEVVEWFEPLDEVWMYNCLQHVLRPGEVLARLTRWARSRIRIFEWVEQPTSEVHLHTLRREEIAAVLWGNGWQPAYELSGVWHEGSVIQEFYAAQWIPLAPPSSPNTGV